MVCGQLHNKGSYVACEDLGLFEHEAGDNNGAHTDEVGGGCHPCAAAEQSACDHADDGHFCAAGDEARGHDGHFSVSVLLDCAGRHDAGDAAAGGNQHGNERFAAKAEFSEHAVHDERDSRHVAAVLKHGKQKEENQHLGNKAQYRAYAADNAVRAMGLSLGQIDSLTAQQYVNITLVMTISILVGIWLVPLLCKKLLGGMSNLSQRDAKWADIFSNAMFIGMISAFLGFVFCDVSRLWTASPLSDGLRYSPAFSVPQESGPSCSSPPYRDSIL